MPLTIRLVFLAAAIALGIVVYLDASSFGARKGALGGGFLDMGPIGWFFVCLFIPLIGGICYLIKRPKLVALQRTRNGAVAHYPPPGYPVAPQPAPTAEESTEHARLHALLVRGDISQWEYNALTRRRRTIR